SVATPANESNTQLAVFILSLRFCNHAGWLPPHVLHSGLPNELLQPTRNRRPFIFNIEGARLNSGVGRRLRQRLHKTHSRFFIAKLLVKPMRLSSMLPAIDNY